MDYVARSKQCSTSMYLVGRHGKKINQSIIGAGEVVAGYGYILMIDGEIIGILA